MSAVQQRGRDLVDTRFTAPLQKSPAEGGWTYLVMPGSAELLGTRGRVPVRGTMDGVAFRTSFMALGDGTHKLPVTAALRRALRKEVGDPVEVVLLERLDTTRRAQGSPDAARSSAERR